MILLEIRNFLSIILAKEIIKKKKIVDYKFIIPYQSEEYLKKMDKALNIEDDRKIFFNEKIYFKKNIFKYILAEKKIKKILDINSIEEIYICNTHSLEKHLYKLFKEKNKIINFYEEGINCYFDYSTKNDFNKNKKLKELIFPKYKEIFNQKIEYNCVYLNFPEFYQYKDYKGIYKIKPSFEISKNRKIIENLFLTRPLSEDNIIDEKIEIDLIVSYIKKKDIKKVVFKIHPRESIEKIKKIFEILKKSNIEVEILKETYPAEELIKYYDIKKLIGFETGTLVYLSENYNIDVDSLLKTAVKISNNEFLKSFYNFYKKNFKKINYM